MLINLPIYKSDVTLISNSGIQFLDFGLRAGSQSGHFVRQSANGPLLRLDYDVIPGKFTLPAEGGSAPEIVRPESIISLAQSLQVFDNVWLPLPFLRVYGLGRFGKGPDNWARVMIRHLETPDDAGHTLRVCLAFDTNAYPNDSEMSKLAPSTEDVRNGIPFSLAWRNADIADFLDQTWVDGWLRELFIHHANAQADRSANEIVHALKLFEYQAHFLNVLEMLGTQLAIPTITFSIETAQSPVIPVDLVLDIGNSHTCGVLIEDHGSENNGLTQCSELQIRSLSSPYNVNQPLFSSRIEFNEARFGKQHFSVESGRDSAFVWPSIVRIGDEAHYFAIGRTGSEGKSGISSPRRYLWDDTPAREPWRFSQNNSEPLATAYPMTTLINDHGQPLYSLPLDDRLPVFTPYYSPASLMTQMLCELLAHSVMQINSVASRQAMGNRNCPRQLRQLILTLPSAMPVQERELFQQRMQEAVALVWKAMGWHPKDDDFPSSAYLAKCVIPAPRITTDWDEASCGQLVWLYNEVRTSYAGNVSSLFRAWARPDRQPAEGEKEGGSLRVALIDIGGGTMDLAITHYTLDNGVGSNTKISPRLLFLEGFKVAGDDILLDIIQRHLIPAMQEYLQHCGIKNPRKVLQQLFGEYRGQNDRSTERQQAVLQLLIPLGQAVLSLWEKHNPHDIQNILISSFGKLLTKMPTTATLKYIEQVVTSSTYGVTHFNVLDTPLSISFSMLNIAVLAGQHTVSAPLMALCEAIEYHCCDVLLVSGRPACLPGIQMLLRRHQPVPASRIVWMHNYTSEENFPFIRNNRIYNPKSTAATGAALFHLACGLRLPDFNINTAPIRVFSTLRYLGELDSRNRLREENIWFAFTAGEKANESERAAEMYFPLRRDTRLGFRQLDNPRWPASPLYTLKINSPELAKELAGDGILYVQFRQGREGRGIMLADAWLQDGKKVPTGQLSLSLNTLTHNQYWIDSGSVYPK
ncbi:virulence factor SrfB [Enterobacter pasteurii]|uniref:virulence factor SrfB n=1 Tax=Enterobacter pasteurii TaxID=3029761 RepID=UPI0011DD7D31|nr:virulence factor SrfB [Enterobacter pasteurii]QLA68121.1 virulence factor SrfB [Enterobacter pasteurii]